MSLSDLMAGRRHYVQASRPKVPRRLIADNYSRLPTIWLVAVFFGVKCLRFIYQIFSLPCWRDISYKENSLKVTLPTLDALRGFAALLVLATHTSVIPPEKGAFGVIIFFCLSGFLLTLPFLHNTKPSLQILIAYFNRRFWRIMPLYLFYILVACFFFRGGLQWFLDHVLFIKSDGHLWTIKQEIYFYTMLPLFVLFIQYFRNKHTLSGIALLCIAYIVGIHLTERFISSTNMYGEEVRLYISPFICGMATACFYTSYKLLKIESRRIWRKKIEIGGIILLLSSLVAFFLFNEKNIWHKGGFTMGSLFCAAILLLLKISSKTITDMLLPLRAIGIVGYSFYLFHWIIKDLFLSFGAYPYLYFTITLFVTYLISCITYTLIETPFIKIGKSISNRALKQRCSKKAA